MIYCSTANGKSLKSKVSALGPTPAYSVIFTCPKYYAIQLYVNTDRYLPYGRPKKFC